MRDSDVRDVLGPAGPDELVMCRALGPCAGYRAGSYFVLGRHEAGTLATAGRVKLLGSAEAFHRLRALYGDQAEEVADVVAVVAGAFTEALAKCIVEAYRRNLSAPARRYAEAKLVEVHIPPPETAARGPAAGLSEADHAAAFKAMGLSECGVERGRVTCYASRRRW
jgi:hypothetical protein